MMILYKVNLFPTRYLVTLYREHHLYTCPNKLLYFLRLLLFGICRVMSVSVDVGHTLKGPQFYEPFDNTSVQARMLATENIGQSGDYSGFPGQSVRCLTMESTECEIHSPVLFQPIFCWKRQTTSTQEMREGASFGAIESPRSKLLDGAGCTQVSVTHFARHIASAMGHRVLF